MMISEVINGTMQYDSGTYAVGVIILGLTLHEVGDKVANHDLCIGTGEIKVGEEIHEIKVRSYLSLFAFSQ